MGDQICSVSEFRPRTLGQRQIHNDDPRTKAARGIQGIVRGCGGKNVTTVFGEQSLEIVAELRIVIDDQNSGSSLVPNCNEGFSSFHVHKVVSTAPNGKGKGHGGPTPNPCTPELNASAHHF